MMRLIHLFILLKNYKNRFLQMTINKKRFSQIKNIQQNFLKKKTLSQLITNKIKCVRTNSL